MRHCRLFDRVRGVVAVGAMTMAFGASCNADATENEVPGLLPDQEGVVFVIGKLDGNRVEFQRDGWEGVSEFECTVSVDCSADRFPMRIHAPSAGNWDSVAVQVVMINFHLAKDLDLAHLTFARAGDETSILALDSQQIGVFTNEVIGSGEGTIYGELELPLGELAAGHHLLTISVAEDGKGNLRHSLDAIILRGELASGN